MPETSLCEACHILHIPPRVTQPLPACHSLLPAAEMPSPQAPMAPTPLTPARHRLSQCQSPHLRLGVNVHLVSTHGRGARTVLGLWTERAQDRPALQGPGQG